ncbi:hypothetical protein K1T71_010389 [Dendrolimus kikuchii]|uniref:Uncharacterized protein n=1 Tax=Dendrolimus kikuchii TaxID=765133 RepID=A0ACC1CRD3_9NEOP|nr:hypothetical protein K1T71_010389 [Dendrolimus kikuchii]
MFPVHFIFVLFSILMVEGQVIVDTYSGKVEGVEVKSIIPDEKYYSFMGIPYAEPPVGRLRFKEPQPHPGWGDVLETKKEKKPCAQFFMPVRNVKQYGFCGEEDCLHLSVHTPILPTNDNLALPVIVFLFNEQFRMTYNASKEYGPDFFMKEEVLLVTISHRVGSLGFLYFEDDVIPGNNGIKDVVLALKWIQINIIKFGGDPFKITLMGNTGGATVVDILLNSPKAKGLFSAAILQSGTSWNSELFNSKPKDRAIALINELENTVTTSSQLISELSRIPLDEITAAELHSVHADEARKIQRSITPFGPVIERDRPDAIITQLPESKTIDIDIPVMIGFNTREAIEMSERLLRKPQYLSFVDRDFLFIWPIRVNCSFEINTNVYSKAIQEIKDFYFDEGYVKISRPGEYLTYIGDVFSFYPIDYTVRKYVEAATKVYYYAFDYSGELNMRKKNVLEEAMTVEGTWGASIGDELCYLFVCKKIKKSYKKLMEDAESEEMIVLRNMVRLWTNFAKTGNPTPPGDEFTWTPASIENKEILVISEELEMKSNVYGDRVKFWDDFLAKYKEKAVDGIIKGTKDEL